MEGESMLTTPSRLTLTAAALCIWAIPVLAQGAKPARPAPPPPPPKPAAQLSQLRYFEGDWTCTGKAFATPLSAEHPTRAHVHIKNQLGGFWDHSRYQENRTSENTSPYEVAALWGYDEAGKQFIAGFVDNMGAFGKATSTGWSGETFIFTGETNMGGQKMPQRDTFTKTSGGGLSHRGEIGNPDGTWLKTDEETCRKSGKK
jgi:hypothetical protein